MVSLLRTARFHPQVYVGDVSAQDPEICAARNTAVKLFLDHPSGAEWLWSVDTDMVWQPDDLPALLALADPVERPIIGAAYVSSRRQLTWRTVDESGVHVAKRPANRGRTLQVACLGMGFTLIHRSVLERMAEAYADDPWHWFGNDVLELGGKRARVSEDFTFCARAIRLGFSVWGGGVCVEHRKTMPLTV
jgi:hypothetical protein